MTVGALHAERPIANDSFAAVVPARVARAAIQGAMRVLEREARVSVVIEGEP